MQGYTWGCGAGDVSHGAFIHKWRKWDAGRLRRRWWWRRRRRGEERLAGAVRLCFSVLMTHLTAQRESTATAWRCECECVCVHTYVSLLLLVQCIHVKRTSSVNSSLFGAKVINHCVTALVVLRASVQVCLLWEQPTNRLWLFRTEWSGQESVRTRERRAALSVLFIFCWGEKGLSCAGSTHLFLHISASVQRIVEDVSSEFSCEKGNDGPGCSEASLWSCRRRDANVKSKCCSGVCTGVQGLQTAAQPLTCCCLNPSPLTQYWFHTGSAHCAYETERERASESICASTAASSSTNGCRVLHAW